MHNYYPDKARGFTFGRKVGVNNTIVDLWDGPTAAYVFPTTPQQMQVVSSSAADSANGTGIQRVHIQYLDAKYRPHEIEVTLNGLTPVLTSVTDILRVNNMHAIAVGTGGVAAGNISLQAVGGAVTYSYLSAGLNLARQAIYTTPDGYRGYINHWQASSGSSGNHFCQTILRATCHDGQLLPGVFIVQDEQGTQNGGDIIPMPIPIPIPPRTDVKISAVSDASNANVTALGAIMGWLEAIDLAQ